MNGLSIRECTLEDLKCVESLQHQWVDEDITHGLVSDDVSYLKTKLGKYFFVAELNGGITGYVYGTIHEAKNMAVFDDGEPYIEVEDLYVSSKCRETGLGSLLLDKILEVAKDTGVDRSLIYSSTKDMDSIVKFYRKHDYKTWYVQMFK